MSESPFPRLLLIGHSHLYAIVGGCEHLGLDRARYGWIYVWRIEEALHREGEAPILEALAKQCDDMVRRLLGVGSEGTLADLIREAGLVVLLSLGGNEHNVVGLVNTGGSYDFFLPGEDEPPRSGSTLVPFGAVRTQMERQTGYVRAMLDRLVELTGGQLACLEPPPPIRDGNFVFAHLDAWFRQTYGDQVAINPAELRYKLWRLRGMVFQAQCSRRRVPYVQVPPELVEAGRYLHPDMIAGDATHANARFGSAMIRAALRTLGR